MLVVWMGMANQYIAKRRLIRPRRFAGFGLIPIQQSKLTGGEPQMYNWYRRRITKLQLFYGLSYMSESVRTESKGRLKIRAFIPIQKNNLTALAQPSRTRCTVFGSPSCSLLFTIGIRRPSLCTQLGGCVRTMTLANRTYYDSAAFACQLLRLLCFRRVGSVEQSLHRILKAV